MKRQTEHPNSEALQAFLLGTLDDGRHDQIEQHVAHCSICCDVMRQSPDDAWLRRIRDSATLVMEGDETRDVASDHKSLHGEIPVELREHPRYQVGAELGSGGMGIVYRAEHRLMERTVALKVVDRQWTRHPKAVLRFQREVKAAARLNHPNIVTAFDAEQAGDLHFLVMEFVDGASLDRFVRDRGPLPIRHACHYIRQAARGLQHAHEQGMIHRDIKPQNLMLAAGRVKILDFGLARWVLEQAESDSPASPHAGPVATANLTHAGALLGTPDYIAPEQVTDSRTADARSDIYSLGCTLYLLLTGRPPFPDGDAAGKLTQHSTAQPVPVSALRDDVPDRLSRILAKMMAKDPSERFESAQKVADALAPLANSKAAATGNAVGAPAAVTATPQAGRITCDDGPPVNVKPSADHLPVPDRFGRRAWWIGIAAALVGVVAIGMALAWWPLRPAASLDEQVAGSPRTTKILFVVPHRHFWWLDYEPLRERLAAAGFQPIVASSEMSTATPSRAAGDPVEVNLLLQDAMATDYLAVVFVGTHFQSPNEFAHGGARSDDARKIINDMLAAGRQVAAVCGGTTVIADSGALRGLPAADHQYLTDETKRRSGVTQWRSRKLVASSDQILTGGHFEFADLLADALIERCGR